MYGDKAESWDELWSNENRRKKVLRRKYNLARELDRERIKPTVQRKVDTVLARRRAA